MFEIKTHISGIYLIKNKINSKIYIGRAKNIKRRWHQHISLLNLNKHHNNHLQMSWNKYGQNNFTFSVLEEIKKCDKIDEKLLKIEQLYIDLYKPYIKDVGYNKSKSSLGPVGVIRNDLTLNNKKRAKKVNQYNLNGVFLKTWNSIFEIEQKLGFKKKSIRGVCLKNKNNKTAFGFVWRYYNDVEKYKNLNPNDFKNENFVSVVQYDLKGNFIKIWHNITEASKELKIPHCNISKCCCNKTKFANGFVWKKIKK